MVLNVQVTNSHLFFMLTIHTCANKIEMAYTVTCCKENEICCGSDKYASLGLFVVELVFVTPEISAVSTMISMLLWGLFVVDMMLVTGEILAVHMEFGFCCG